MLVWKLNKGWKGLEENALAGGWTGAEQFATEAQISKDRVEELYWLSNWDGPKEVNVTGMKEIEFDSISSIGEKNGTILMNRYYNVSGHGFIASPDVIYIPDYEFEQVFC